jgi:RHS repeat-associated protein
MKVRGDQTDCGTATGEITVTSVCPGSGSSLQYDSAEEQCYVGGNSLKHDTENRASSISDVSGGTVTYAYDADGHRVARQINSNPPTTYVYDALGQLTAEYESAAQTNPCTTCYLNTDHLGTTRMVTDENCGVAERHDFTPLGEEIYAGIAGRTAAWPSGSNDFLNQKFTGKERDQETGLDYFGARYFGGALGRFSSPDVPLVDQFAEDPQSWNLYSYVRNNPLSNIDPNGEDCITTSNQSSSGVEVTTERGGSAGTCSGTYVDGTVNTNSYQYNGSNLTYSFANDTSSGAGNIQFGQSGSDDALSPFAAGVLSRAGAMAAPGVNLATQGLRMFGYAVAAPVMAAAECAAGAPSCTTGNVAMALLPELGALKAGGTILKVGAAAGKGAEIIQKAGGVAQAVKDFDALSGAESVNGAVRVKTFSDGSRAVLYTSSSTGQASIAIQEAGRTATKIRY